MGMVVSMVVTTNLLLMANKDILQMRVCRTLVCVHMLKTADVMLMAREDMC